MWLAVENTFSKGSLFVRQRSLPRPSSQPEMGVVLIRVEVVLVELLPALLRRFSNRVTLSQITAHTGVFEHPQPCECRALMMIERVSGRDGVELAFRNDVFQPFSSTVQLLGRGFKPEIGQQLGIPAGQRIDADDVGKPLVDEIGVGRDGTATDVKQRWDAPVFRGELAAEIDKDAAAELARLWAILREVLKVEVPGSQAAPLPGDLLFIAPRQIARVGHDGSDDVAAHLFSQCLSKAPSWLISTGEGIHAVESTRASTLAEPCELIHVFSMTTPNISHMLTSVSAVHSHHQGK